MIFFEMHKVFNLTDDGHYAQATLYLMQFLGDNAADVRQQAAEQIRLVPGWFTTAVDQYQQSTNQDTLDQLLHARRELCRLLEGISPQILPNFWNVLLVHFYTKVAQSGIRNLPRCLEDEDLLQRYLLELQTLTPHDPRYYTFFLAAALLGQNFELPLPTSLDAVPDWALEWHLDALLEYPHIFLTPAAIDQFIEHLTGMTGMLHQYIFADGSTLNGTDRARRILKCFDRSLAYVQTYFSNCYLKKLFMQRADLVTAGQLLDGGITLIACVPECNPERRLKLGIYMTSFTPYTESYFLLSHFEHLDRQRFEIVLYTHEIRGSNFEQRCFNSADSVVKLDVTAGLQLAVDRIRNDQLDIMVFGQNITAVNNYSARVAAYRVARIQVASICSPVSTGYSQIDVMLASTWNEPSPGAQSNYSEYLCRIPGSLSYYSYQYDDKPATAEFSRQGFGIPESALLFMSAANHYKIMPELSRAWGAILAKAPNSMLLLLPFSPAWGTWHDEYKKLPLKTRLEQDLAAYGVAPDRLVIVPAVPTRADVHRIMALGDIYLDSYPFSGGCSMIEALIACLPPITWCGLAGRSQYGASALRMVGLDQLIADSAEAYIDLAVALAGDAAWRQAVRQRLLQAAADNLPPYFATKPFAGRVGAALEALVAAYRQQGQLRLEQSFDELAAELQQSGPYTAQLTRCLDGAALATSLLMPLFYDQEREAPFRLLEVGAGSGLRALPFVRQGWQADLFEPDQRFTALLEANTAEFRDRCRVLQAAVSAAAKAEVRLYYSKTPGLSSLEASPVDETVAAPMVSNQHLADYCVQQDIRSLDLLLIDAAGHDGNVLASLDLALVRPQLIVLGFDTRFAQQSLQKLNALLFEMRQQGYRSVVCWYALAAAGAGTASNKRLHALTPGTLPGIKPGGPLGGSIIFCQEADTRVLMALLSLVERSRCHSNPGERYGIADQF